MVTDSRARLDMLLSQDPREVAAWASELFDSAAAGKPVVLFGAGGLGRRALAAMRAEGHVPAAFADNAEARQGSRIDGVPVLSPSEAVARYPDGLFVITIWGAGSPHRQAHSRDQLRLLGAHQVLSFPPLFWRYTAAIPHYLIDRPEHVLGAREEVQAAFALLSDEASRSEFVDQISLRLSGEFDHLSAPVWHPQYFPPDLVQWREGETVLDGGAFDGDSLKAWMQWRGPDFAHWAAVEPDPINADRFEASIATLPEDVRRRIALHRCVLDRDPGSVRIDGIGTAAATRATGVGGITVDARTIDTIADERSVSLIKLDIEGAELDAIAGAARTIVTQRPILAIAAYHHQNHLWRVPLAISSLRAHDRFVLRPHNEEGWDLVCYAIPKERST